ncbi:MAG: alpha/beta fold hydrolase [Candidatus Dormibacter sp.]|uniref:alpha/beta fold hydrolase n=1 Tax=Candidatus Dormibacter sp. TaxID=2973982 RepID=UPI003D9B2B5D
MVLALPGFSQGPESWAEQARLTGSSQPWLCPELAATTLSAASAELEASSSGAGPLDLIGYSQGGRLALYAAARGVLKLRTLTVISAQAGFEGQTRAARLRADEELAGKIEVEGSEWFAEHWALLQPFAGLRQRRPDLAEALAAARRRHDPTHLAAQLRGMGAAAEPPFWSRLAAIEAPTLVIAGGEDERYVAYARRLALILPHCSLEIVPDAGHVVHLEQPGRVARILARHLHGR